jgi:hypothetical protein
MSVCNFLYDRSGSPLFLTLPVAYPDAVFPESETAGLCGRNVEPRFPGKGIPLKRFLPGCLVRIVITGDIFAAAFSFAFVLPRVGRAETLVTIDAPGPGDDRSRARPRPA